VQSATFAFAGKLGSRQVEHAPDFLSLLAPEDRAALEDAGARREYPRGCVMVHRGDDSAGVFVLLEGRVKIAAATAEARDAVLAFRGPGDLVGELGAIDGEQRSADVAALEPVVALALAASDFQRLIAARPGIGIALLRVVAGRQRDADRDLATLGAHDVLGRVARRLIDLCDRYGTDCEEGVAISLPLTQEELAGWTGSSREAVSKALNTLRGLGWVETRRRELVVTDLAALRTYTGVGAGA
jgi:CRP/FNR family transcriptional regulator, cyclic AMP receptor protein